MRTVVVYKEFSDQAREVFEWIDQFEKRTGRTVEQLDPETPEGEIFCSARDILQFPAVVVCDDDGKTYEQWIGQPMPQIDTVVAYVVN
ncbi:hypothetical protein IJH46_02345 [Candidatus Saccharibacteria bacterium]|nr:hypothetical protein [Candidatus Saccharibacteria bacterium]